MSVTDKIKVILIRNSDIINKQEIIEELSGIVTIDGGIKVKLGERV